MATVFSPPIVPLPPFLLPFFFLSPCIQTRPSFFVPPVFPKPETLLIICHSCSGCCQFEVAGLGPCLEVSQHDVEKVGMVQGRGSLPRKRIRWNPETVFLRQRT